MSNFLKDLKESISFGKQPFLSFLFHFALAGSVFFILYTLFQYGMKKELELVGNLISAIIFGILMTFSTKYSQYKQAQKELSK